ncbi:hypothetical protein BJF90_21450 [Pseudonocardia sp. CNS-004]|nr:hypothetical protein BJF90_21450 [Pseudonocardia sp. CNS-004]
MTRLVDDIDGSQAVTTLSFGLDGRSYEIDLSESHLSAFRQALAPFITAARALPGGRTPTAVHTPEPARAAAAPAARAAAPAPAPAPKQRLSPPSAGNAAAAGNAAPEEETSARPTVDVQPFQPPSPAPQAAAPARSTPVPLVADPFNPRS